MVLSKLRKQLRTGRCEKLIQKAQRAPRGEYQVEQVLKQIGER